MMLKTLYMRLIIVAAGFLAYGDLANGWVAELQHLPVWHFGYQKLGWL